MPDTFCNYIQKGLFVSHQGMSLCCVNDNRSKNVKPSEFWNGEIRRKALHDMQTGEQVNGCEGCYKTESKKMPSSRNQARTFDHLPTEKLPTMLDIDFSNFCNLKCVMCKPARSSQWAKELGLPVSTVSKEIIEDVANISDHLQHLTLVGGEPTIMKEYEYYFELLERRNISKNVNLKVITNATNVNNKFYSMLAGFKSVKLSISVDAYGPANDYIRWPSKFSQIHKNVLTISELPANPQVELFNSLNILSMFNYGDFLHWCKDLQEIFESKGKTFTVCPLKIQSPKKYSTFIAPSTLKEKFTHDVKSFMKNNTLNKGSNWRTEMLMILNQINATPTDNQHLNDLKHTVKGFDSQRGTNIQDFIPNFNEYI